ncbi:FadR/GntR family transcriptional regulator [Actinokineospora globicatena]|uniref:Transcriptional regulator n=1 Tax=Actinokineospora globicatena TaxID=103729 RepID=A0A9W6QPT3_9PSEU|nr:FCD domain-containing protein [Actinokineospora globicatena]MCP2300367.1 DNA-binding transcriptional regulator, FadR family [Actinokineospora globicatena]GLW80896.1 transcriptional regulator [Actinokineospora globicatena]GLW88089.1 transcriptional regulator [Actinokineospora globicatena]GLW92575.1 transcriptional regulator [Actinokineospora globicatena]
MTSGLPGRLLDDIGPAIVSGEYPAGAVLRTEELERAFQVSRTVVREALRVLEAMRLVSSKRRVGITVLPRTDWNLYDPRVIRWRLDGSDRADQLRSLTELRSATEPVAAALAAVRATPEQAGQLTELAVQLRSTTHDLEAFLGHDIAFHRVLLAASGNDMFCQLGDVVDAVLTGRTHHHLMPETPKPEAVRLHVAVAEAVAAGDPVRAEASMRAIVTEVLDDLRR